MLTSKGGMRAKLAAIFMDGDSYIIVVGNNIPPHYDVNGVLYSLPCMVSTNRAIYSAQ